AQRARGAGGGDWVGVRGRGVSHGGGDARAEGRRGVGQGRDGGQGEGADRARVALHAQGPGGVHLLSLRRVGAAHAGGDQVGDRGDRVRDGAARVGGGPLAPADERGGGGGVGANAGRMAAGWGGRVTLLDRSLDRLRYLADVLPSNVDLVYSNGHNLVEQLRRADLVIGAVLLPGAKAPKLVRRDDLKLM